MVVAGRERESREAGCERRMIMRTMKRFFVFLMMFMLAFSVCHAEIIPPYGEGQIGLTSVVLCEELTVREGPGASYKAVMKLQYGARPIVMKEENGWAYIALGDGVDDVPPGWVNTDYLAIDPAWYRTEATTAVYAWNDVNAPKVALLDKDETLPVLKDDGDWLVVSLRGASGWIRK